MVKLRIQLDQGYKSFIQQIFIGHLPYSSHMLGTRYNDEKTDSLSHSSKFCRDESHRQADPQCGACSAHLTPLSIHPGPHGTRRSQELDPKAVCCC